MIDTKWTFLLCRTDDINQSVMRLATDGKPLYEATVAIPNGSMPARVGLYIEPALIALEERLRIEVLQCKS